MTPAAAAIILPALLLAAPAGEAASAGEAPEMTVTVSDGVEQAAPGDVLRYVVVVDNTGGVAFSGSMSLRTPDFVEVTASGSIIDGDIATWPIEVPAGESTRFEAEATVGDEPGDAYQVVALAEIADSDGAIIVRAADADSIPGALRPPDVPGLSETTPGPAGWALPAGIAAVVALAGLSLAGLGAYRARRTHRPMG